MFVNALASALPDGVLQVVQGDGSVGEQLVSSDDVHMIAMTGSSATGKRIMYPSSDVINCANSHNLTFHTHESCLT